MARAFRGECDECKFTTTRSTRAEAREALLGHTCLHRCSFCHGQFTLLVDDGPLCVRCDALFFPPTLGRIA